MYLRNKDKVVGWRWMDAGRRLKYVGFCENVES